MSENQMIDDVAAVTLAAEKWVDFLVAMATRGVLDMAVNDTLDYRLRVRNASERLRKLYRI